MSQARQALTPRTCSQARRLVGWSSRELAKRSGVSQQTIKNFEAGTHRPRYDTVTACLRAFAGAGVIFLGAEDDADCVLIGEQALRLACA